MYFTFNPFSLSLLGFLDIIAPKNPGLVAPLTTMRDTLLFATSCEAIWVKSEAPVEVCSVRPFGVSNPCAKILCDAVIEVAFNVPTEAVFTTFNEVPAPFKVNDPANNCEFAIEP